MTTNAELADKINEDTELIKIRIPNVYKPLEDGSFYRDLMFVACKRHMQVVKDSLRVWDGDKSKRQADEIHLSDQMLTQHDLDGDPDPDFWGDVTYDDLGPCCPNEGQHALWPAPPKDGNDIIFGLAEFLVKRRTLMRVPERPTFAAMPTLQDDIDLDKTHPDFIAGCRSHSLTDDVKIITMSFPNLDQPRQASDGRTYYGRNWFVLKCEHHIQIVKQCMQLWESDPCQRKEDQIYVPSRAGADILLISEKMKEIWPERELPVRWQKCCNNDLTIYSKNENSTQLIDRWLEHMCNQAQRNNAK